MSMTDTPRRDESHPDLPAKKRYSQPTLTEYGSVAKLTMTKGTTTSEAGTPNIKKACL